jgi:hypothetical protein
MHTPEREGGGEGMEHRDTAGRDIEGVEEVKGNNKREKQTDKKKRG